MQKLLAESEARYRAIFDNSSDAVVLALPNGRIEAANAEACRLFKMTEKEMIQAGRQGIIDVSDPKIQAGLVVRDRTGRFKGEVNLKRKDGTVFPVEISSGFFTDHHGVRKAIVIIRDISERKRMEEELKRSKAEAEARAAQLAATLDTVPAITFIALDPKCRHMTSSQATREFFRLPDGISVSKSAPDEEYPSNFRRRELTPEELPMQVAASTGHELKNCEFTVALDDGTEKVLLGNALPIFDS